MLGEPSHFGGPHLGGAGDSIAGLWVEAFGIGFAGMV